MGENKKTRAEIMAESHIKKLQEIGAIQKEDLVHKLSDVETPEQKEKLKKALAKLRTFLD